MPRGMLVLCQQPWCSPWVLFLAMAHSSQAGNGHLHAQAAGSCAQQGRYHQDCA